MVKVNNRNTRTRCEICSKLIKTPEWRRLPSVLRYVLRINVMRFAICYHLCNFKNVKNTHGGVLVDCKFTLALIYGCFSHFLNCTKSTKLRKASQTNFVYFSMLSSILQYSEDLTCQPFTSPFFSRLGFWEIHSSTISQVFLTEQHSKNCG